MFFGKFLVDSFILRTVLLFASTTFSIFVVMFLVGIITVDDIITIFNIKDPNAIAAVKNVAARMTEVTKNLVEILSKLLNQLFGWAGVDVDLSKIKVDTHGATSAPPPGTVGKPSNPVGQ